MAQVSNAETKIDYEVRGGGDPLLMIMGFSGSRVAWREPLLSLMESHFQLILMDNRGTGFSDRPQEGARYSMELFADDAAAVLTHLGIEQANVFGVSMGGMIAQKFAERHPDRLKALVLGCTHGGRSIAVQASQEVRDLLMLTPNDEMDAYQVVRAREPILYSDPFREANRTLLDAFFEENMKNPTPVHALDGQMGAIVAFDGLAALGQVRAPTMILTGDKDRLVLPENSKLLADRIPGADLRVIPDTAHLFWCENPEQTSRHLVDFLKN